MKRLFWWVVLAAFFPALSYAQSPPSPVQPGLDALNMMVNLSKSYPFLWLMITGMCYIIGMVLAIRAVYYLKVYGELRTMTSTSSSMKVPLTYIISACVFLFIPTAFSTLTMTVFGQSSPIGWENVQSGSINPIVLKAVGGFVELLGLVSFVRGWMMLVANAQSPGGGQGSFGKGVTHIIGGFLLINIYGLVTLIWNTFGLSFTL